MLGTRVRTVWRTTQARSLPPSQGNRSYNRVPADMQREMRVRGQDPKVRRMKRTI
jgi:hypothetical protein